jgi:acyl carrier protein
MSENPGPAGPQFRADRPVEHEAVRTTIVGGRPPGSGQPVGNIPRGIEVLVKKAAVDAAFKERLLSIRAAAAGEIGLWLEPAEAMMLAIAPAEQLEAVIARTAVPQAHRRAFLGQAAAAMLAVLGLAGDAAYAVDPEVPPDLKPGGVRPDVPWGAATEGGTRPAIPPDVPAPYPLAGGVRPDEPGKKPAEKPKTVEQRVVAVIAKHLKLGEKDLTPKEWLIVDLDATPAGQAEQRKALEKEFQIAIPAEAFKKLRTVGNTVDYVQKAVDKRDRERLKNLLQPDKDGPAKPPSGALTRGIRPDLPRLLDKTPKPQDP